jgi:hypothetical protein
MDFLYVANAVDLNSGKLLGCRKVGIALSDIDKRISTLNSTKMPISVTLESGYDFTDLSITARDAEYIIHSVLSHDRVNGEWFKDPDSDLVDRVRKAVVRLGAKPFISDDPDIKEMNSKQSAALSKMQSVFEPIQSELLELGINWEYMTWKVGLSTPLGRLHINVNDKDLRLVLTTNSDAIVLYHLTGLNWRDLKRMKRKSTNIVISELLDLLNLLCTS